MTTAATRCARPGLEPGSGDAAATGAVERLRARRPRSGQRRIHSSAGEATKLAFADREKFYGDPDFVHVPMATLLSDAYNDERRKLISDKASLELWPGSVEGFGGVVKMRRETASASPSAASARASRRSAASARLTATPCISISSTRPATWCRRRPPAAGCNLHRLFPNWASASAPAHRCSRSTRKPSGRAGAGQAAAHDAVADSGAARRRALSGLGFARRRPAGSMDHAVLPAPCAFQHEHAGSDRRAGLALGAFPDFVLAAHLAARRFGGRTSPARDDDEGAATAGVT